MKKNEDLSGVLDVTHAKKITAIGLELPENLNEDQILDVANAINRVNSAQCWWWADLVANAERGYGDLKNLCESDRWNGPAYSTCRSYITTANRYELLLRSNNLSFNHHRIAASIPSEQRQKILTKAEKEGWSTRALQEAVNRITGKGVAKDNTPVKTSYRKEPEPEIDWDNGADGNQPDNVLPEKPEPVVIEAEVEKPKTVESAIIENFLKQMELLNNALASKPEQIPALKKQYGRRIKRSVHALEFITENKN